MPDSYKTRKILSALESLGFKQIRQKGSHLFLEHPDAEQHFYLYIIRFAQNSLQK